MAPHSSTTTAHDVVVGVDVGGTTTATILLDDAWTPVAELTVATDVSSPDNTLRGIAAAIDQTLAAGGVARGQVAAIGLGVPGQIDTEHGIARLAVNLFLRDYPLGPRLAEIVGVPVLLDNDVRVATLGVHRFDNPAGDRNLVYVSIGTGLATGVILDGRLLRGRHNLAGEFGHMIVQPGGPLCNCGTRGCLEAVVSATAVIRRGRAAVAAGRATMLAQHEALTARDVYAAAAAGDAVAQEIVDTVGAELGRALRSILVAYDVDAVVLGGGVTRAGSQYLQPILAEWERQRAVSHFAHTLLRPEMLRIADPTRNMGAWGAAALAAEIIGA
jgi:glucokinase